MPIKNVHTLFTVISPVLPGKHIALRDALAALDYRGQANSPDVFHFEDVEMLQDMIRGAVNEAGKRVDEEAQGKMRGMLGGMGLPPGMI